MKMLINVLLVLIPLFSISQSRLYISSSYGDKNNKILRYDVSSKQIVKILSKEEITDMEFDESSQILFWLDEPNNRIMKYDFNTKKLEIFLSKLNNVKGIYLNQVDKILYFSDGIGTVSQINYDGSKRKTIIIGLTNITQFAIDFDISVLFYFDASAKRILRINLNGENKIVLADYWLDGASQMILDTQNKLVYWSQKTKSSGTSGVRNVSYSGGQVKNIISTLFQYFTIDFAAKKIYGTEAFGELKSYNIDGSNSKQLLYGAFSALVLNKSQNKLYVADYEEEELLYEVDLSNNAQQLIVTRKCKQPHGIKFNPKSGKLFMVNQSNIADNVYDGSIVTAEINGKEAQTLLINDQNIIRGIKDLEIDEENMKIYWLDDKLDRIRVTDFDGSNTKNLNNNTYFNLSGIKLDKVNKKIYWSDFDGGILKSDLDGKNIKTVYLPPTYQRISCVEIINNKIYWLEKVNYSLKRCDLDGNNVELLLNANDLTVKPENIKKLDDDNLLFSSLYYDKIMKYNISAKTFGDYLVFNDGFSPTDMFVYNISDYPNDNDGDGFFEIEDCNDTEILINDDAEEILYNDIDENCDGIIEPLIDADQDGYFSNLDCNDNDSAVHPGAIEIPYDGIDNDCDSLSLDDDLDQDGFLKALDCDDTNPEINPSIQEIVYNGIDDDCNPSTRDDDLDQDGFVLAVDCDDSNPNINPNAQEIANNGIDENCDGKDLVSSIFEISDATVEIFPNPVSSDLQIIIQGPLSYSIKLYDLQGKVVYEKKNVSSIKTDKFINGTYFIEIKDLISKNSIIEKIIVDK